MLSSAMESLKLTEGSHLLSKLGARKTKANLRKNITVTSIEEA